MITQVYILSNRSNIGEQMPRRPNYDRDDLIDRARDLFWRSGWAGTSLKDLEATLKMKPGSFYAAFGSKEALYELALEKYSEGSRATVKELVDQFGAFGALTHLPAVVVEAEGAPAKACMVSKTLLELHAQNHPLAAKAEDLLNMMEEQFTGLFRQAQADGDIDPDLDPAVLARRYQSDLLGLRLSAERSSLDASAIAAEFAESLGRLRPAN